jgi:phosphoglycerate dehydrogenase-like enzyme
MHPEDPGFVLPGLGDPEGRIPLRLYPPAALHRMLGECDFVVVCAPLSGETRFLFTAEAFAAMRTGAYLVDLSRGGIVQGEALCDALTSGTLAGAALDVTDPEPLPANSPLWAAPNLIISPHIAGGSPEYDRRAMELFAENLERYLAGQPLLNRFDPEKGY